MAINLSSCDSGAERHVTGLDDKISNDVRSRGIQALKRTLGWLLVYLWTEPLLDELNMMDLYCVCPIC